MRRVIKKYTNRKMYDTENSCYITAVEVGELLRKGTDVVVVDNKTGVDITGPVLAQALLGNEKDFYSPSVIEKLKNIIRAGGFQEYAKAH